MKILNKEDIKMLQELAKMEANMINNAFAKSEEGFGMICLANTLYSFEQNYLKPKYGKIVVSMCSEYRVLLVEILKNIKDEYKDMVLSAILIPRMNKVTDKELMQTLEKLKNKGEDDETKIR